jgi:hypothetical protein
VQRNNAVTTVRGSGVPRSPRARRLAFVVAALVAGLALGLWCTSAGDDGTLIFDGDPGMRARLSEAALDRLAEHADAPSVSTGSARFDGEWMLVTLEMNVLGLGQVAIDDPTRAAGHLRAMRDAVDRMLAPERRAFGTSAWGADGLGDAALASDDGHAYLGYLALAMSMLRVLSPTMADAALHDRLVDALERRIAGAPHGMIETYPGEAYPPDVAACIGAIGLRAHALGRPVPEAVRRWASVVRAQYLDEQGYLAQSVDAETGAWRDGGRGSGTAIASYFLSFAEPTLSRDLEQALSGPGRARVAFVDGVREHVDGTGGGDVDSGPVVLGVGVAATGFALGAARAHGDRALFVALYGTAHRFGLVEDDGRARSFRTGLEIGNAILFAMLTARDASAWTADE